MMLAPANAENAFGFAGGGVGGTATLHAGVGNVLFATLVNSAC